MSSREGPTATIAMTCQGCKFLTIVRERWEEGTEEDPHCTHPKWGGYREIHSSSLITRAPDWCPHLPGPLVAVPVPAAVDSVAGLSVKEALGRSHSLARDEGWNACRSEIIQRASALGQEVTDV